MRHGRGKGTELTHAYVDASDWSNHRRAELLDRYGFVCDCRVARRTPRANR